MWLSWLLILASVISGCSPDTDGSADVSDGPGGRESTVSRADGGERAAAGPGRIVPTGNMTVMRAAHTATPLPDGRVIIAGGCTLNSCEIGDAGASAELYDPRGGSFTRTGEMGTERVSHTATLLSTGEVLVAGGWDRDGVLASAELYDPATGTFTSTGDMADPRAAHTATRLRDGKVLISGGYDGDQSIAGAEIYDPKTGTFARTDGMTAPRSAHTAARLPGGRVLIAGGSDAREEILASTEIYDQNTGRFTQAADMTVSRYKHAATRLRNGKILILGGSNAEDFYGKYASAELFDPDSRAFTAVNDMNAERFKLPGAVAALDGDVLVGGDGEHAEIYEPGSEAFRTVQGSLGAARSFATATPLPGGEALIAGGYDRNIHLTTKAWLYLDVE